MRPPRIRQVSSQGPTGAICAKQTQLFIRGRSGWDGSRCNRKSSQTLFWDWSSLPRGMSHTHTHQWKSVCVILVPPTVWWDLVPCFLKGNPHYPLFTTPPIHTHTHTLIMCACSLTGVALCLARRGSKSEDSHVKKKKSTSVTSEIRRFLEHWFPACVDTSMLFFWLVPGSYGCMSSGPHTENRHCLLGGGGGGPAEGWLQKSTLPPELPQNPAGCR